LTNFVSSSAKRYRREQASKPAGSNDGGGVALVQLAFHGFEEAPITFAPTFKLRVESRSLLPKSVGGWCSLVLTFPPSPFPPPSPILKGHLFFQWQSGPLSCTGNAMP
jgi:hypothetical protein